MLHVILNFIVGRDNSLRCLISQRLKQNDTRI